MRDCVYTKDKFSKRKKFKDGFVRILNNKLLLFDENKDRICESKMFKVDDDGYISSSSFLIYLDDPYEFIYDEKEIDLDVTVKECKRILNKNKFVCKENQKEEEKGTELLVYNQGRSNENIYEFFKK